MMGGVVDLATKASVAIENRKIFVRNVIPVVHLAIKAMEKVVKVRVRQAMGNDI